MRRLSRTACTRKAREYENREGSIGNDGKQKWRKSLKWGRCWDSKSLCNCWQFDKISASQFAFVRRRNLINLIWYKTSHKTSYLSFPDFLWALVCQIDKRRKSLITHKRSNSWFLTFPNFSIVLMIFSPKAFWLPNEMRWNRPGNIFGLDRVFFFVRVPYRSPEISWVKCDLQLPSLLFAVFCARRF